MDVDAHAHVVVPVDVTQTQYPHTVLSALPKDIARDLRGGWCGGAVVVENVVRFVCGGGQYEEIEEKLDNKGKMRGTGTGTEDVLGVGEIRGEEEEETKTITIRVPGPPQHTLHSISLTSPMRKKVDITTHQRTIWIHSSSDTTPSELFSLPLSAAPPHIPQKKHWSVVLMTRG